MNPTAFQDLLARVRSGDQEATTQLVRHYEPEIRRLIRVKMTDPNIRRVVDSTDIFQSVILVFFVKLTAGLFDLSTPEDLLKLLITMAENKLIDYIRKPIVNRVRTADDGILEGVPEQSASTRQSQSIETLFTAVKERMTSDEIAVTESRVAGRSWAEIAQESGINPDAVRKRHVRALDRICRELGYEGMSDE